MRYASHNRLVSRANFIPVDQYGCPKKFPQKIKSRFCEFKLFPSKKKFHETCHVFPTDKPFISKSGFSVLTPFSTKLQIIFRGLDPVKRQR